MAGTSPAAISVLSMFKSEVTTKLAGVTARDYVAAHPGEHLWATWGDCQACGFCGIVKRKVGENNPCQGITRLGLR